MGKNQGTEPPSQRKLRKAKERGELPYSREFTSAGALVGAVAGAVAWLPGAVGELLALLRVCLSGACTEPAGPALRLLLEGTVAIGSPALAGALLLGLWQTRFEFRLRWRLEALDPLRGLARLFSRERLADVGLLVARTAAFLLAGAALGIPLALGLRPGPGDPEQLAGSLAEALSSPLALLVALAAVWGVFDLWLQRRRFTRRQRMTRQEVLQEHREEEGDPHLRQERRRRHRALLAGGLGELRRAAVVVANPTHLAVALRYLPQEDEAPVVACSGKDEAALRIRREAARRGIPVVENVMLARALYRVAPGEEIPGTLYQAVAEVLRSLAQYAGGAGTTGPVAPASRGDA